MAKDGNSNFEIPAEMRAFAEKSVAQAKLAFDSFISAAQQAVNTAETHAATARVGAKEAGDLAMTLACSRRWAKSKDDAILHAEYVKSQVATLTEQAKELSKQAAKIAGQTTPH